MNIQDRAALVLQQITAALALVEKATPAPWSSWKTNGDKQYTAGDWYHAGPAATQTKTDADFIAASRADWPTALRCLKTVIEGLLDATEWNEQINKEFMPSYASVTLATLCDQWEAKV